MSGSRVADAPFPDRDRPTALAGKDPSPHPAWGSVSLTVPPHLRARTASSATPAWTSAARCQRAIRVLVVPPDPGTTSPATLRPPNHSTIRLTTSDGTRDSQSRRSQSPGLPGDALSSAVRGRLQPSPKGSRSLARSTGSGRQATAASAKRRNTGRNEGTLDGARQQRVRLVESSNETADQATD